MARASPGRRVATELAAAAAAAVAVALLAPFGVLHAEPVAVRLAYWLRTLALAYLVFRPLLALAALAARRLDRPPLPLAALATVVGSAPLALALWWLGPHIDLGRPPPSPSDFLETYLQVLLLAGLCLGAAGLALRARGARARSAEAPASTPEAADAARPFFERLPRRLGRALVTVSTEDHYLRVRTDDGEALVLMRMADAEQALAGLDGLRVHRSWWVARRAVAGIRRRGRALELVLVDGRKAPVARNRVRALAAAGWLDQPNARRASISPANRAATDRTTEAET